MREVLEFYADPRMYWEGTITPESGVPFTERLIQLDQGERAREALAAGVDVDGLARAIGEADKDNRDRRPNAERLGRMAQAALRHLGLHPGPRDGEEGDSDAE